MNVSTTHEICYGHLPNILYQTIYCSPFKDKAIFNPYLHVVHYLGFSLLFILTYHNS